MRAALRKATLLALGALGTAAMGCTPASPPVASAAPVSSGHVEVRRADTLATVKEPAARFTGSTAVKHWHGATATQSVTHIAIQEQVNGNIGTWMEHVTDEQYNGPPPPHAHASPKVDDVSPALARFTEGATGTERPAARRRLTRWLRASGRSVPPPVAASASTAFDRAAPLLVVATEGAAA